MAINCFNKTHCDGINSIPAKLVFDKNYVALGEGCTKYQDSINRDLQQGIKANAEAIEGNKAAISELSTNVGEQHEEITEQQIESCF